MKLEYSRQAEDEFTMTISALSAAEMDAIRILLQTAGKYACRLKNMEELSLDKMFDSKMFK